MDFFVPPDAFSRWSFCHRTFCSSGRFVQTFFLLDDLSLQAFFPTDDLLPNVLSPDVSSGHQYVWWSRTWVEFEKVDEFNMLPLALSINQGLRPPRFEPLNQPRFHGLQVAYYNYALLKVQYNNSTVCTTMHMYRTKINSNSDAKEPNETMSPEMCARKAHRRISRGLM